MADPSNRILLACSIDGQAVRLALLSYREPNFGRPDPDHAEGLYELSADLAGFLETIRPFYEDFADDDRQYGDRDEASVVLEARRLGWPPLEDLLTIAPDVLGRLTCRFFGYDAFTRLFGRVESPQFLLNTIDEVAVTEKECVLRGRAICLSRRPCQ